MQPRAMEWMRVALSALALMVTACGTNSVDLSCRGDQDCLDSEICHPDDHVCMQLCIATVDCPKMTDDQSWRCETLSTTRVCKCQGERCPGATSP
jgi:hypothetical protein